MTTTQTHRPDTDPVCVITVYGKRVDVVALYRKQGFAILPPVLTMHGSQLADIANFPAGMYGIRRKYSKSDIPPNESVVVEHGDEFIAIPHASTFGINGLTSCQPQEQP